MVGTGSKKAAPGDVDERLRKPWLTGRLTNSNDSAARFLHSVSVCCVRMGGWV